MAFFSLWGWEEGSVEGKREPQKHCCCLITQSCPTFLRPCGPLSFASAVHQGPLSTGILQVRTLAWIAVSFSRGSLQPRGRTCIYCTGRQVLDHREHLGSPPNASVLLKMRRKWGSVGAALVSYTDPAAGACGDDVVAARTRAACGPSLSLICHLHQDSWLRSLAGSQPCLYAGLF